MGIMNIAIGGKQCRVTELAVGDEHNTRVVADDKTLSYYSIARSVLESCSAAAFVDEYVWHPTLGRWEDVAVAEWGDVLIHVDQLDVELRRALAAAWP